MKFTAGVPISISFIIKKKKPTEIREKMNIAKPNKNLNRPSIHLYI